jgi:hypothetical protein
VVDEEALFIKGSSAFINSSLKGSEKTGLPPLLLLLYVSIAAAMRSVCRERETEREREKKKKIQERELKILKKKNPNRQITNLVLIPKLKNR